MKTILIATCCLFLLNLGHAQNLEQRLLGKWQMHQVVQNGADVSDEHNPQKNRYITFNEDGSFESGGDPYGINTGQFYVNNLNNSLYIDSSQGPDDDSTWYVTIDGDLLTWQGFGNDFADGFKLIHKRSK